MPRLAPYLLFKRRRKRLFAEFRSSIELLIEILVHFEPFLARNRSSPANRLLGRLPPLHRLILMLHGVHCTILCESSDFGLPTNRIRQLFGFWVH